MIRSFDPTTERFLAGLAQTQQRAAKAMEEISTGYRVNHPSDAPDDITGILHLHADVTRTTQIQSNLGRLKNEVDSAQDALQTVVNILDQATVIGAQGLGLAMDATTRGALAIQVQELHRQVVGLTQLNVQGRYVFSGDQDQQPQYSVDATNLVTGVARNHQAQESRQITDAFGSAFTAACTAQDLFDHRDAADVPDGNNVFAAIQQLNQGLANNDRTAIGNAITALKQSNQWLNRQLSFYGSVQNRIIQSTSLAQRYQTQWKMQLGDKRDADIAEAITELQASQTQQQAALSAKGSFGIRSLFDYLR